MKQAPIPQRRKVAPNKRIVSALKEAKTILWNGKGDRKHGQEFAICYSASFKTLNDREEFWSFIALSLDDYAFYRTWLGKQPETDQELLTSSHEYVQEGRHRWVDQMIEDFGGSL